MDADIRRNNRIILNDNYFVVANPARSCTLFVSSAYGRDECNSQPGQKLHPLRLFGVWPGRV
ncbi:MAG: hypothetical protein ABIK20_00135 [Candidatus Omnitrophota bacterium]